MGSPSLRPPKSELRPILQYQTYAQAAKIYKVNQATVGRWAKRYKITRSRRGSSHHSSLLTEEDIHLIRALKGSVMGIDVAKKFEVDPGTIYDVWEYRTWWWM